MFKEVQRRVPSLQAVASHVIERVRAATGASVDVLYAHLLEQVARRGDARVGGAFHTHQDTEEEVGASDRYRTYRILFTVIVRLDDNGAATSMVVQGYKEKKFAKQGSAVMFDSDMWHATAQPGGRKIAFFVGSDSYVENETWLYAK